MSNEETDRLEQFYLGIFVSEIEEQCRFALRAYADIEIAITTRDSERQWYSIQALLVSLGNISKLLWGTKPRKDTPEEQITKMRALRKRLRETLQIEEPSILKDRKFRDHFEHYDERIGARMIEKSPYSTLYVDKLTTNFTKDQEGKFILIKMGDKEIKDEATMVEYNSSTHILKFRDERYDLEAVVLAVAKLQSKCSEIRSNPFARRKPSTAF